MQRWEHTFVYLSSNQAQVAGQKYRPTQGQSFEDFLMEVVNRLGSDGWEMAGATLKRLWFKRPLPDGETTDE